MDGRGRRGLNGGSGGSACHQDDALGCWWEAVPPLCLFFRLALGGDNGVERFRGVQPGRHVGQDARETQVVLWGQLGRRGKVDVCPALESDARALVHAKGEWGRDDLWRFDGNGLEEGQDVVAIIYDGGKRLVGGRLSGSLLHLTWLRFSILDLNGDDAIVVVGLVCLACGILFLRPLRDGSGRILRISPASDSPCRIAASVRNGRRKTELCGVQSLYFLDCARSPAAARRRTSAISIRILSPSAKKAI